MAVARSSRFFAPFLITVFAGCGPSTAPVSPFSGTGAIDLPGVLGVASLSASGLDELDQFGEESAAVDGVDRVLVLWLDPEVYGGPAAFVAECAEPDRVVAALVEARILTPIEGRESMYRWSLMQGDEQERFARFAAERLAGPFAMSSGELKRYDREGQLVLVPTSDLREPVLDLADAVRDGLGADVRVAVALEGRKVAAWVDETFRSAFDVIAGLGSSRAPHGAFAWSQYATRLLVENLEQVDGIVALQRGSDDGRLDVIVSPLAGTALASLAGRFRPRQGEWPDLVDVETDLDVEVCVDPIEFVDAVARLSAPALPGLDAAFVESFAGALDEIRTISTGTFAIRSGEGDVLFAMGVRDGVDLGEARRLLKTWFGAREPTLRDGWLVVGADDFVMRPVVDRSDGGVSAKVRLELGVVEARLESAAEKVCILVEWAPRAATK